MGGSALIIINADDWGRSVRDTDSARALLTAGRITSVSAMVLMKDSVRAAALAKQQGIDPGLHLNFCENFDAPAVPPSIVAQQARLARFLNSCKFAQVVYNPALRRAFDDVCKAQFDEFGRLYGVLPSHIDGHRHFHLCMNMLVDAFIPRGLRVRRSFSFVTSESSLLNRTYRRLVDARLSGRYVLTDYFFSLQYCLANEPAARVRELARTATVEVMTHPRNTHEFDFLSGDRCRDAFDGVPRGTHTDLQARTVN